VELDDAVAQRARVLGAAGYGLFDALQVAEAEAAGADVSLSTDDRLIKRRPRRWQPSNRGAESAIFEQGPRTMIALDQLTDEQFERHALEVLKRELGADGLARFLRLHRSGPGDYTLDRDEWQKDLTLDQVIESIRAHRQQRLR
jgi:hypothetical protein